MKGTKIRSKNISNILLNYILTLLLTPLPLFPHSLFPTILIFYDINTKNSDKKLEKIGSSQNREDLYGKKFLFQGLLVHSKFSFKYG